MFKRRSEILRSFKSKRAKLQRITSVALPAVLLGGWFYPPLGFFLLLCMAGAVGLAMFKGRAWCDWMCPRGSFYDLFLRKLSRNAPIPSFLRTKWFRTSILIVLLSSLGAQVYYSWGSTEAVAMAFVRVLTVTTTAGIVLGALFQERAWCHICPMGTLGNWFSRGKKPLYVSEQCKSCKLCSKVCPMQLRPFEHKSGAMTEGDCIKCSSCVAACPINALDFKEERQKAA
jgi:polyferredoxin